MTEARTHPWWSSPWTGVLLLGPLWLLPNYAYYHDGVMNASYVLYGDWQQRLHPHHLGYNTLIWSCWQLLGMLGVAVHPLGIMASFSRVATLVVSWQSWTLARHLGLPPIWATLCQLAFGLSFATWSYGTNAAVYLPTLALLLALLQVVLSWNETPPTRAGVGLGVALLVVATLVHELAILFALPLAWWCAVRARAQGVAPWPLLRVALLGTLLPLVVAYALGFAIAFQGQGTFTLEALGRWLFRYGQQAHHWVWHRATPEQSLAQVIWQGVVEGHGRLLMASTIGERFDPITGSASAQSIQAAWPAPRLWELWRWLVPSLGLLTLIGGVMRWNEGDESARQKLRLVVAWTLPLLLFCTFFEPQQPFYRLYYWPLVLPLLLLPVSRLPGPGWHTIGLGLIISLLLFLASLNAAYGYLPRMHATCNPTLATILSLTRLPEGPLLFATTPDAFEEMHFARLLLPERPIYKLQQFTEAEYARSRFGTIPLADRLRRGHARLPGLGPRLLVSQGRPASGQPPFSAAQPILRLSELQSGRPEPSELWLHLGSLAVRDTHDTGDYVVLELIDPLQRRPNTAEAPAHPSAHNK